jgi:glycerol-3-phosphate dehydrogenase (NAD(P)+)
MGHGARAEERDTGIPAFVLSPGAMVAWGTKGFRFDGELSGTFYGSAFGLGAAVGGNPDRFYFELQPVALFDLLAVVPSHGFRATLMQLRECAPHELRLAWATKGFEHDSGKLLHVVAREVLGEKVPLAVLSGPTFAREVAAGVPTALTIAASDGGFAHALAESLRSPGFRAYTSDDMAGVETGGAVKNVIAIGCGISDGLKFGANARAALITRGLTEITRLGVALGARAETFQGLAGLGDLVLTCTDDQSRNRRMGLALAGGKDRASIEHEIGQVVEGVPAAEAVHLLAQRLEVEMPITECIYRILYEGLSPRAAVETLMSRELKSED